MNFLNGFDPEVLGPISLAVHLSPYATPKLANQSLNRR